MVIYSYSFDNLMIVLTPTYSFRLMFHCNCLLPQSFTMHHIYEIPHPVVFTYSVSNYMDVSVQRRGSKLYFIEGWLDLLTYYDQPNGMWVKLVFLERTRFLIEELFPRSFVGQVQVPSPPCFIRLSEDLRSRAHNEIEFPQFKSVLLNSCRIRICNFNDCIAWDNG
ncbi:uncharacterized protein DS421_11g325250 [Arachis hypogaea]|nr:uncharacterized protein DS421_11g325250 [Arachis hypogaea]